MPIWIAPAIEKPGAGPGFCLSIFGKMKRGLFAVRHPDVFDFGGGLEEVSAFASIRDPVAIERVVDPAAFKVSGAFGFDWAREGR